ncbi:MAG: hypothetical protein UR22_C0015G0024 [Parcubacteria group bacterium GW2011_GWC2_32_10]|nr:MAG: hypothetical protein UR22_C0015G0024 [Parcubacteria group bacterium GW2011_GWC2_32_10]
MVRGPEAGGRDEDFDLEEQARLSGEYLNQRLESKRDGATELAKNVAGAQGKKAEIVALTVQERVKDDEVRLELTNKINGLIDILDQHANFGNPEKPLEAGRAKKLVEVIDTLTKKLNEFYEDAERFNSETLEKTGGKAF